MIDSTCFLRCSEARVLDALSSETIASPALAKITQVRCVLDQIIFSGAGTEVKDTAIESEGHAARVIVTENVPFEHVLLVAFAILARKTGPSFANGVVEAVTVLSTKHVAPYFFGILHSHVAYRFSLFHDCLL